MSERYNVVIIGAGIGGLICGTYLAQSDLKVLIVEAHDKPGGCVTSITRKGFNFDVGAHLIGSCNSKGIFRKYLRDLGINIEFVRLDPTDRLHFPEFDIDVSQEVNSFVNKLGEVFPREAIGIRKLYNEIMRIAVRFDCDDILDKYQNVTFYDFMMSYIKNEKLAAIISAQYNYIGEKPKKVSALSMSLMLASYLKDGSYLVAGGAQNLSNRLFERFKELGGTGRLKAEAVATDIRQNRIEKIVLENGDEYRGDYFVSNIDARKTFYGLISENKLPRNYIDKLNACVAGQSFFLLFLIIDLSDEVLLKCSGWYHSSFDLDNSKAESFYVFVPSIYESSIKDGPKVMELAMPCSYDDLVKDDYSEAKDRLENKLLDMAEKNIPGLRKSIKYKFNATPQTIEKYTGNSQGSMYGWRMTPAQVQRNRLPQETPIENLLLAGHWTTPGCGVVSVATSGWKAAKKIIALYKKVLT